MKNGLDDFDDPRREAFKEGGIFSAFGPEPGLQSSKEKYVIIKSTSIRNSILRVSLRVH
jgi:hypothetical protein